MNYGKKLRKAHTKPLITNHIIRAFRQFLGGYQVSMIQEKQGDDPDFEDFKSINRFLEIGVDNIISGVITDDLSQAQLRYSKMYNVGDKFSILSWNRIVIRAILDFSNSLWQYRSGILHSQKEQSREQMVKNKAIELLTALKRDPYRLPYTSRDLCRRSNQDILRANLSKFPFGLKGLILRWKNRAIESNWEHLTYVIGCVVSMNSLT